MKDWEVICELQAGNRLLKRERYKLLEKIKELETDSALRYVVKLRDEIKDLKQIINHAVDGIETLSVLDSWPEGQMKKDVMAIKETLENVENTPKPNPQADNPRE